MEKRKKYDFELKLKFLKFFHLHWVMPTLIFPKNGYLGGVMIPANTVSNLIFQNLIKKKYL